MLRASWQHCWVPKRSSGPQTPLRDQVDELISGWANERPDLDTTALAVVYRLTRVAAVWNGEVERLFAGFGLTSTDFAVLAVLRRHGPPYRLNQRQILRELRLTSGTVSLRVDKMVERGLVTRGADPADGRAMVIGLTDMGSRMFDRVAPDHLANEARLLAAIPPDDRLALARILRGILIDVEQPENDRPDVRLGFVSAGATAAQRKRAELGLGAQHGLLVETVNAGGPAELAGIRVGDTISHVDGRELHSLACLAGLLDESAGQAPSRVMTVVRGTRSLRLNLDA